MSLNPNDDKNKTDNDEEESSKEEEIPKIESIDPKRFAKDKTVILTELPSGVGIPKYLVEPDSDSMIARIEKDEAMLWLVGPFNIGTDKKPNWVSFSARVTWVGTSRRFVSKQIQKATVSTKAGNNFWKVWQDAARFWRNQEYYGLVKDPDFIRECLSHPNWQIRFVVDEPFSALKVEGKLIKRNVEQWLAHPFRLRKSAIQLGQEVPLLKGEAKSLLQVIKAKKLKIKIGNEKIIKYLNSVVKKEILDEKEEKAKIKAMKALEKKENQT